VRILYFTRDYTPHDHRFLSALACTGNQVFSLRLEQRGPQLEDRPLPPQVQQVVWRGGQRPARRQDGPSLWWDLKRVIRCVQPDLIHAGPVQSSALLAALVGFRPLVTMSWGSDLLRDAGRDWLWRWATGFTLRHTSVLVGDCQAVADRAAGFGFPAARTVLFPWGVDIGHFTPRPAPDQEDSHAAPGAPDLRRRLGWQDALVLLSTRSWEPLYGVDVLADAFVQAAARLPELRLIMLGNGSQAARLRQIFTRGEVLDRVFFGGQVSYASLPLYYRSADLYLSASHSDGSSVSLLEALACGVPAIVSDIPGNREWITPGREGWLFPDGQAGALAKAILEAAGDPHRRAEASRSARGLAERRANWEANFPKLLEAYRMALTTGRNPALGEAK